MIIRCRIQTDHKAEQVGVGMFIKAAARREQDTAGVCEDFAQQPVIGRNGVEVIDDNQAVIFQASQKTGVPSESLRFGFVSVKIICKIQIDNIFFQATGLV